MNFKTELKTLSAQITSTEHIHSYRKENGEFVHDLYVTVSIFLKALDKSYQVDYFMVDFSHKCSFNDQTNDGCMVGRMMDLEAVDTDVSIQALTDAGFEDFDDWLSQVSEDLYSLQYQIGEEIIEEEERLTDLALSGEIEFDDEMN